MNGREPFLSAAATLIRESGCTVRRWRTRSTGTAYVDSDDWGIECPEPRGPVSFATLAHEVGHQLKHRVGSRPRWLEEVEAWEYALEQFARFNLYGLDAARMDAAKSLRYAAAKAEKLGSAETVRAILDRYPEWVWNLYDDPRDAVTNATHDRLVWRSA